MKSQDEILELLKSKTGFGAIDLFPQVLEEQYPEIMDEQYPGVPIEEFEVFVTFMPYDEEYPWDLFVKAPGMNDFEYWGDSLSTEGVIYSMANEEDLDIIETLLSYDIEYLREFLEFARKEYEYQK
jgi:hypothetical protein